MTRLPHDVIGAGYVSTAGWTLLEDLVDLNNRMPGQEGERRAAERIERQFREDGLRDVTVTEFPIPGWWRGRSSLELPEREQRFGRSHEIVALPGTPAGEVAGEIVDVGYGLAADFEGVDLEGKIVMASSLTPESHDRWVHRCEKYGYAVEAGASGFLFYNHLEGNLPPTGDVGERNGPAAIPAVGISRELGKRLVRYCADGPERAVLTVDCRNEPATTRNVEAVVGPDTDREVLFTAHVDAHDVGTGANDNGFGCALVVEVARLLRAVEDDLDTRVRFVTFGAEETGLYGSYYWTHTRDLSTVKCVLNVDGAGYSRSLDVHPHGFDGIGEVFEEVSDEYGVPISIGERLRPHSDHWPFVQRGVPGAQGRSLSSDNSRGWGHTHGDTLDKLDVRDLRDLAILCASGVKELASADREFEHVPSEAVRETAVEQGFEEGLRRTGTWPWAEEQADWPWEA
ncbi:M28 family peptidase [Halomarina pelagica]|uniref:M28 family peptidase n=1 Tax=Halomarina pelagica TaxID=2961599 RepID=UPI0020C2F733|nr:M28 family peptidase [Halomarina sp. BND7]